VPAVHDWVLWILAAASALHVVEEHALGWQGWAAGWLGRRIGMVPSWMDFWHTNGFLIVFASLPPRWDGARRHSRWRSRRGC
jgi:hypothetical protein